MEKDLEQPAYDELAAEIRRLEDVVRRGQLWHATLIETISSPIFYKDLQGLYLGCNKAFEEFIGRPRSDIIGKTVYDIAPGELAKIYEEKDRQLMENPGRQRYEFLVKAAGGDVKDVIFDKATLFDANGTPTGLVGIISDITEQKRSAQLIHELSQMLIQAQERERYMISCELHDTIAQNLSALKLGCSRMVATTADLGIDISPLLKDAYRLIDETIHLVRGLAHDLRPSSLDHLGLIHAIEIFCRDFTDKHCIQTDFQTAGMKGIKLGQDVEINLYRIVQESLKNIRKHARATKVSIRLIGARPYIILRIKDNGQGFDVNAQEQETIKQKRMGLSSMKTRASLLHGRMAVYSKINEGTEIIVKFAIEDIAK